MIFHAESMAPVMAASARWGDLLDITVIPATPAEEGLQLAKQMVKG